MWFINHAYPNRKIIHKYMVKRLIWTFTHVFRTKTHIAKHT